MSSRRLGIESEYFLAKTKVMTECSVRFLIFFYELLPNVKHLFCQLYVGIRLHTPSSDVLLMKINICTVYIQSCVYQ